MSSGSLVIMIVCSVYASVLVASPIKREATTECKKYDEPCKEIGERILNKMYNICEEPFESATSDEDIGFDLCEVNVTITNSIISTTQDLIESRKIIQDSMCNEDATPTPQLECWSTAAAYKAVVKYLVYTEHMMITLTKNKLSNDSYATLANQLRRFRCSMACHNYTAYTTKQELREDILRELEKQPEILSNVTHLKSYECKNLHDLLKVSEEMKQHLENPQQLC